MDEVKKRYNIILRERGRKWFTYLNPNRQSCFKTQFDVASVNFHADKDSSLQI